jgi:hypothetical protein
MDIAIITEKDSTGRIKTIRSTAGILTHELEEYAKVLDEHLAQRIPQIEKELIDMGVLEKTIPKNDSKQGKGDVLLWHSLGNRLSALCKEEGILERRERRWLWEAIENIHATRRIIRAARGRTRLHFEYCYRLSNVPIEFAEQINWSEWVYFFDSRTVRDEPRIDEWLLTLINRGEKIDRKIFRRFVQQLNKRIKNLDTSELSKEELFPIYDKVWTQTMQTIRPRDLG